MAPNLFRGVPGIPACSGARYQPLSRTDQERPSCDSHPFHLAFHGHPTRAVFLPRGKLGAAEMEKAARFTKLQSNSTDVLDNGLSHRIIISAHYNQNGPHHAPLRGRDRNYSGGPGLSASAISGDVVHLADASIKRPFPINIPSFSRRGHENKVVRNCLKRRGGGGESVTSFSRAATSSRKSEAGRFNLLFQSLKPAVIFFKRCTFILLRFKLLL